MMECHAGAYFSRISSHENAPFLPVIAIRFQITDSTQDYHIPLLLSPFGYQVYRGS